MTGRLKTRDWKTWQCLLWKAKMHLFIRKRPTCVNSCSLSLSSSLRICLCRWNTFQRLSSSEFILSFLSWTVLLNWTPRIHTPLSAHNVRATLLNFSMKSTCTIDMIHLQTGVAIRLHNGAYDIWRYCDLCRNSVSNITCPLWLTEIKRKTRILQGGPKQ